MDKRKIKFVDAGDYERKALAILRVTGNLRLVGETGVGKTTFVHYLCDKYNWKLYEYALTSDTSRWDLLAQDVLEKGTTKVREGIVALWLKDNDFDKYDAIVLYLDEFNYADPSVLSLTNSLADFRKSIFIPELQTTLYRSEKHYIIISYNPSEVSGYTGTFKINIAQLRRFEGLVMDWLPRHKEVNYLVQESSKKYYNEITKLVDFAQQTRENYRKGSLSFPITTGNLLNYVRLLMAGLEMDDILEIVLSFYPEDEKDIIRTLWGVKP